MFREAGMRVTVMHAEASDLSRVPGLVRAYQGSGYADGSRPRHRQCVIYAQSIERAAAVWGGPDHIRVAFQRPELPQ